MRRRRPVRPKLPTAVPPEWDLALRHESRAKALRWGLHGLVVVVLFGLPCARGQLRARETRARYARAAACMYGGAPAEEPSAVGSVDDPSGRYAAMFLERSGSWPTRCEGALRELARDPADLVFPSVKATEADVQRAAELTLQELSGMSEASNHGAQVPLRPLWGLQLLRNAVEANASAADESAASDVSAVTFSTTGTSTAPTPTLLDVDADTDATLQVWGGDASLEVAAFDRRGVSYVRLLPEATTRARLPRAANLRSVVRRGDAAYLVWTTARDKCGLTDCAGRSMGLAPMPVPLTTIPAPRWVAAHPFGSPERSLAFAGTRMWIAAANLHGRARLVELSDVATGVEDAEQEAPLPVTTLIDGAQDLVVFTDAAGVGALALQSAGAQWELWRYADTRDEQRVATWPRTSPTSWLRTCATRDDAGADTRFFVLGSSDGALVGSMRNGATRTWPLVHASIPAPPKVDRDPLVALACDHGQGVTLAFVDAAGALQMLTCRGDRNACALQPLAEHATAVAVAHSDRGVVVAYSGAPDEPQVQLRRLSREPGGADTEALVPGPCWERWGGMCGEPRLAWAGNRLILTARSGRDLMALQSIDAGARWTELGATNVVNPPPPHVLPPGLSR